jgi:hypothetical protein
MPIRIAGTLLLLAALYTWDAGMDRADPTVGDPLVQDRLEDLERDSDLSWGTPDAAQARRRLERGLPTLSIAGMVGAIGIFLVLKD